MNRLTKIALAVASVVAAGSAAKAELIVATTANGFITTFDSASPGTLVSSYAIRNVAGPVIGIDYRPANGQVYLVSAFGGVYTVDYTTGNTSLVSTITVPLNGSSFGVDFNPTVDRLRITSNADTNLRVDVTTGATTVDTNLAYGAGDTNVGRNPNVVGSAYTNSLPGSTSTTLYDIDAGNASLATQTPPNNGTLNTVGSLLGGVDINELVGFDISGATGVAYASLVPVNNNQSSLYTINLATGAATLVGQISGGSYISGLTVIPVIPEPAAAAVLAPAALGLLARRRK